MRVNEGSATSASVPGAYIVAHKSGALIYDAIDYAGLTYDFKKIGDASDDYNCLAYALGVTSVPMWPTAYDIPVSLKMLEEYLADEGFSYTKVDELVDGCIVVYGKSDENIKHFALYEKGIFTAKLGPAELVQHSKEDAYYDQTDYGNPIAYYVRNP